MMMYSTLRLLARRSMFLVATFSFFVGDLDPGRSARNIRAWYGRVRLAFRYGEDHMRLHLTFTTLVSLTATAFVARPTARQQASLTIREYLLPHTGAFAHDPAVGSDGIVWFADQPGSYIGRLDPETGDVKEYPTPTPGSGPHGIIVAPDGAVWYTGNAKGLIARLDPKTGKITEFPTGARDPHTPLWLNGSVWFTAQQANKYGSLNPATGEVKLYDVETNRALPYGLQRAPDGTLWIAMFGTNKLGHLDPATAKLTEIDLPNAAARPRRLAVTSDGRVWYSDYARGYLGMYDPKSKATREWKTPNQTPTESSNPYGIGVAPNGMIWFNEARQGNMVMFNPATEKMEVVAIPTRGSVVRNVSIDSTRHRLWIAESGVNRIGRIDLK
jgi:virginiamycin B lyase